MVVHLLNGSNGLTFILALKGKFIIRRLSNRSLGPTKIISYDYFMVLEEADWEVQWLFVFLYFENLKFR